MFEFGFDGLCHKENNTSDHLQKKRMTVKYKNLFQPRLELSFTYVIDNFTIKDFRIYSRGGSRPVYKVCTNLSEFFPKIFLRVYIAKCK